MWPPIRANRSAAWLRRCSAIDRTTAGEQAVTEPPFRMDPNARFDDEVARIARENNADVAFKLVDREDGAVSTPDRPCCFDHDRNGQPVRATQVIIVESRGQHYEYESCQGHAYGRTNAKRQLRKPGERRGPGRGPGAHQRHGLQDHEPTYR